MDDSTKMFIILVGLKNLVLSLYFGFFEVQCSPLPDKITHVTEPQEESITREKRLCLLTNLRKLIIYTRNFQ